MRILNGCRVVGFVGLAGLLAGCSAGQSGSDDTGVGGTTEVRAPTTGGAASSTGAATTGATMTNLESSGEAVSAGDGFIPTQDHGDLAECDLFAQDCPAGEKCAPYASGGGGAWNATKCVPVMAGPAQVEEACVVVGDGVDSCDLGLVCWYVDEDDQGRCVALCKGSFAAPYCEDPATSCPITGQGLSILCLPGCDPLSQDCDNGEECVAVMVGEKFECVLDASGEQGQVHDPCMFANSCDPGLACVDSAAAGECDQAADRCCEPFCELGAANVCAGAGQVCLAWFAEGTAPEGYEDVGFCSVPL